MDNICAGDREPRSPGNQKIAGGAIQALLKSAGQTGSMLSSSTSKSIPKTKKTTFHIKLGDLVEDLHTKQLRGIVRHLGPTNFAAGDWVGIELECAIGKNNGSVNGQVYFVCEPNHG